VRCPSRSAPGRSRPRTNPPLNTMKETTMTDTPNGPTQPVPKIVRIATAGPSSFTRFSGRISLGPTDSETGTMKNPPTAWHPSEWVQGQVKEVGDGKEKVEVEKPRP